MTQGLGVYIETYGCQMNEYDSELVKSILVEAGHSLAPVEADAGVILLNTCAVRENAHTRIYHRLQQLKALKAKSRHPVTVGILGFMAQNLRDELIDTHHEIDFIAGPDSYRKLPELIQSHRTTGDKNLELTLSRTETYSGVEPHRGGGVNESLTVRKHSYGVGVERVFPIHSPRVEKIEVVRSGRVRRAKLHFLRKLKGKAARLKEE